MSSQTEREGPGLPRLRIAPHQLGFATHVGPFYEIALDHGMRRAVLLDHRHLTPEGVIHGGAISTFADYVLYRGIGDEIGHDLRYATIELNCQFLAAAFANRWIYGEAHVLRRTNSLVFAACEIFDQKRRVAFASGIWKLIDSGGE